jgi:hypothetical protein
VSEYMTETRKGGCGKYIAIGCGSLLLLAVIGGFFIYRGIKGFISDVTAKYTETTPLELPSVDVSDEEAEAVLKGVSTFTEALEQQGAPAPLVLTSQDINILIHRHPDWKELAGKVHVTIKEDEIHGQISIPLDNVADMFKGRYLNGSAVFRLGMAAERLLVFMDSTEVGDEPLPEELMKTLREKNLAEDINKKPDTDILQRLDSIAVKDGALTIVPKPARQEPIE